MQPLRSLGKFARILQGTATVWIEVRGELGNLEPKLDCCEQSVADKIIPAIGCLSGELGGL